MRSRSRSPFWPHPRWPGAILGRSRSSHVPSMTPGTLYGRPSVNALRGPADTMKDRSSPSPYLPLTVHNLQGVLGASMPLRFNALLQAGRKTRPYILLLLPSAVCPCSRAIVPGPDVRATQARPGKTGRGTRHRKPKVLLRPYVDSGFPTLRAHLGQAKVGHPTAVLRRCAHCVSEGVRSRKPSSSCSNFPNRLTDFPAVTALKPKRSRIRSRER